MTIINRVACGILIILIHEQQKPPLHTQVIAGGFYRDFARRGGSASTFVIMKLHANFLSSTGR